MPRGGSETILLVEDESEVRSLTRLVLERAGYRVLEASDGRSALDTAERHRDEIDLLFTDLVMPGGIDGSELGSRLLTRIPRLRVVFTSGYSADHAARGLSLRAGQNFLQKPATTDDLLATIRRSLDGPADALGT